ncbi:MAG TPA: hypothetical protein VMF29_08225, partial [Candidatus Edwardsbacteria bacterium]|nr:hypothetical protein [Candidatus Edwardsbacteria bacterium]
YWRVVAHKNFYSKVSPTWGFQFSVPALITPPADTIFASSNTPTFIWHPADSAAYYTLRVSTNQYMSDPYVVVHSLADTAYTILDPLADGHYYWQVQPIGSAGNFYSVINHFSVNVYGGVDEKPGQRYPRVSRWKPRSPTRRGPVR